MVSLGMARKRKPRRWLTTRYGMTPRNDLSSATAVTAATAAFPDPSASFPSPSSFFSPWASSSSVSCTQIQTA